MGDILRKLAAGKPVLLFDNLTYTIEPITTVPELVSELDRKMRIKKQGAAKAAGGAGSTGSASGEDSLGAANEAPDVADGFSEDLTGLLTGLSKEPLLLHGPNVYAMTPLTTVEELTRNIERQVEFRLAGDKNTLFKQKQYYEAIAHGLPKIIVNLVKNGIQFKEIRDQFYAYTIVESFGIQNPRRKSEVYMFPQTEIGVRLVNSGPGLDMISAVFLLDTEFRHPYRQGDNLGVNGLCIGYGYEWERPDEQLDSKIIRALARGKQVIESGVYDMDCYAEILEKLCKEYLTPLAEVEVKKIPIKNIFVRGWGSKKVSERGGSHDD